MIEDREARPTLRTVARCRRHPWRAEGSTLDLTAALHALVACLARYDTRRGGPFAVDATHRIRPASLDMPARAERAEWVQRLAVEAQHSVPMVLGRETGAASARGVGQTSAREVTQRVARWRREAVQEGRCCFTGTGSGKKPWTFLPA